MITEETRAPEKATAITELSVEGMSCGNCARHVTEALQAVPGVASARVALESKRASVRWASGATPDERTLLEAIGEAGYEGKPLVETCHDTGDHADHRASGWHLNLWVGLLGMVPLMLGEWLFHLQDETWFRWFSFVLATIVQIVAGAGFYRGAWKQLKVGSSSMDTLVALGSTTAYAYSAWALFSGAGTHLYFMEAASIITLISTGHWLEARMSSKASTSLKALLNLAPATARRRAENGAIEEIAAADLRIGDAVLLKPGDQIPTDAIISEGESSVEESMLTGESMPIEKRIGSAVYAGTLNLNGQLVARVTATGDSTALAQVIEAVQRAQTSRANIQRLGDKVSNVFVPIVVCAAVLAGLWWGLAPASARAAHDWLAQFLWASHLHADVLAAAIIIPASVLIIACPCAMGLATPAAIMAGADAAAKRGILIRDGVALEKAGKVTAVLFDKTGTLTQGKPVIVDVQTFSPGLSTIQATELAASLANHSNHPLSKAVAAGGSGKLAPGNWKEVAGGGVQGTLEFAGAQQILRLGSFRWLVESSVHVGAAQQFLHERALEGATILGLSAGSALLAAIALRDDVKPGARAVVEQLRSQRLKIYLVTGDNARTGESIARQLGIDPANVRAEIRPEQKAEIVKELQAAGERVAFVGDGINDSPALEQSDLGVAVSKASDIAREAADIILLNSEIEAVPESLGLARATLRTIKQNLFWAFFYNAVGIPLAALGFMSPVLCAAAMGLSDVVVIGNALRLRRWGNRGRNR